MDHGSAGRSLLPATRILTTIPQVFGILPVNPEAIPKAPGTPTTIESLECEILECSTLNQEVQRGCPDAGSLITREGQLLQVKRRGPAIPEKTDPRARVLIGACLRNLLRRFLYS